jgi:hypothetical protein
MPERPTPKGLAQSLLQRQERLRILKQEGEISDSEFLRGIGASTAKARQEASSAGIDPSDVADEYKKLKEVES